jgi:hypothetical protein
VYALAAVIDLSRGATKSVNFLNGCVQEKSKKTTVNKKILFLIAEWLRQDTAIINSLLHAKYIQSFWLYAVIQMQTAILRIAVQFKNQKLKWQAL